MKRNILRSAALGLAASVAMTVSAAAADLQAVVDHYAEIAHANYEDALITAKALDKAVDDLLASPSEETLKAARQAWLNARPSYQQTEHYRFGNPVVDDWEGKVNAWPLDEGLIDYVDVSYGTESDENPAYVADVIANKQIEINGETIDTSEITPDLLENKLQEAGGIEANVATGYHAIEFLLWGQDLNGNGPGAGNRPYTDYDTANCTHGNCDRRGEYLKAASTLLVSDLQDMTHKFERGGEAAKVFTDDPGKGLIAILTGMGSLSYGELAGERTKLGLLLHDPEEEHDCFSDNTYNSHYYDVVGIVTGYDGTYTRTDGTVMTGPSIKTLLEEKDPDVAKELEAKLAKTLDAAAALKKRGETVEAYDQMIAEGNEEGNAAVQALVDGLVDQTKSIQRAVSSLGLGGIEVEGSDSLDSPNSVFQ
ncbi:imelysin family protein [Rhizobium sp. L1K21]|uniref:imelysin family protein n=1 Tax=Rhizobium sp. L1K21 TaxID=2954933 RepID=UPI002092D62A|nr:imelysin family protein [Rhizobium sp. L1K21]MCO6187328.1 peptidase [Rhizobium sp. L1K21]